MPSFTPYSAPSWQQGQEAYNTQAKGTYAAYPDWQRYSGDWNAYEKSYYDAMAGRIGEARQQAQDQFMNRQRKLGVGDSPTTDTLWGQRMEPTWANRYTEAADSATKARAQLEMTDLNAWNQAQAAKAQYENNQKNTWINNYLQRDASNWNTNTQWGRQNMLDYRQNTQDPWTAMMKPLGQIGGMAAQSYMNSPSSPGNSYQGTYGGTTTNFFGNSGDLSSAFGNSGSMMSGGGEAASGSFALF